MSIASELQNYEDGLGDAYDAAQTMGAVMPAQKNMNNLDATILTIPQPTVNDGTLTIQQNGTTLGTFTANQASNTTVNITGGGGAVTTFHWGGSPNYSMYKDSGYTTPATYSDIATAYADGLVYIADGEDETTYVVVSDIPDAYTITVTGIGLPDNDGGSNSYAYASSTWTKTATQFQTKLSAGTNIQINGTTISATDTTYSNFVGATSSVAGSAGLVPAPAAGDEGKALHGDGTWKDTTAKLVEMSYGESSAWAKFIAAYNAGSIVYCRASSNANPGTGSQTRKAFMAYVNNATAPTSVEFQYVRSVGTKSDSQQCDQVFVYTLTNTGGGTWSVATRDMATKINVDSTLTKTYSGGANASVTLSANAMTGATSGAAGTAGYVPAPAAGDEDKVLSGAGTWVSQPTVPTVNDGTLTIQHNGTNVQTFTANQSTSATANIQTIYSVDAIDTTAVTPTVTADMIDWTTINVIIDDAPSKGDFLEGTYTKIFTAPVAGYYEISTPFSALCHRTTNALNTLVIDIDSVGAFSYTYASESADTEWGMSRRLITSSTFTVHLTAGAHTLSTAGNLYWESAAPSYTSISVFTAKLVKAD